MGLHYLYKMAKELIFFKFNPGEWIKGDITLCSMTAQGVFINLCCYYWMKDCSICLANAKQRFSKDVASINELLKMGVFTVDENDNIIIKFLDEQMNEFIDIAEKRSLAGRSGGLAKAKQMLSKCQANAKQKPIYKDKEEDKDKDKDKDILPTIEKVTIYCDERKNNVDPNKFFDFYEAKGWMIGKNKMKDWKAAVRTWEKKDGIDAQVNYQWSKSLKKNG